MKRARIESEDADTIERLTSTIHDLRDLDALHMLQDRIKARIAELEERIVLFHWAKNEVFYDYFIVTDLPDDDESLLKLWKEYIAVFLDDQFRLVATYVTILLGEIEKTLAAAYPPSKSPLVKAAASSPRYLSIQALTRLCTFPTTIEKFDDGIICDLTMLLDFDALTRLIEELTAFFRPFGYAPVGDHDFVSSVSDDEED